MSVVYLRCYGDEAGQSLTAILTFISWTLLRAVSSFLLLVQLVHGSGRARWVLLVPS
jgi:hypothetical protein